MALLCYSSIKVKLVNILKFLSMRSVTGTFVHIPLRWLGIYIDGLVFCEIIANIKSAHFVSFCMCSMTCDCKFTNG